jgi:hypothetical protein
MGTPTIGPNHQCSATPGTPVDALDSNLKYGWIFNPFDAPGTLWIDPTGDASATYNGHSIPLVPGWSWYAINGSSLAVSAASTFPSHLFICIQVPA